MWINPKTNRGWPDAEEQTFDEIMRTGNLDRLSAIRLYKRLRSNKDKALTIAREQYGLTEVQLASYEQTKAARLAGLAKARQTRSHNRGFQQSKPVPGSVLEMNRPQMASST